MRRKITLAFLILAAFLLQTTVFQYFQIASVTPNLLLILTSAFGLMRGKKEGLMVGFFSGLMIDLFYGRNPICEWRKKPFGSMWSGI